MDENHPRVIFNMTVKKINHLIVIVDKKKKKKMGLVFTSDYTPSINNSWDVTSVGEIQKSFLFSFE